MKNKFFVIFLLLFWAITFRSQASDTYDSATGVLTVGSVSFDGTLYKNVRVKVGIGDVISVGSTLVPDSYDSFNGSTLTIPVVTVDGSATYYNVVTRVGDVLAVGSSCIIASNCTKVGTPEVKGVLPGDGRISVQFNFMGGKIVGLLTNTNYVSASKYVAVCTSSDGLHAASSTTSVEYTAGQANYANPVVVSGLTNGKAYTCTVTATADDALSGTSSASSSVIPNSGSASSTGVLSASVNTVHASAYPNYDSYCNYTNETATGLPAVATVSYYNTSGVRTTGTSRSTITCTASTRTVTSNALPDHLASQFFTNGLTGYTGSPYNSGQPNSIGEKSVSKSVPLSGTISTAYVKGDAGFDTSACYSYTSTREPSTSANYKWATGGAVWSSGTVRCQWVAYFSYLNNGVKVEPGTAETYTSSGITYKAVGKNLYQDVGLDPSNAHNQPTMSGTSMKMYGYYHVHGMPEGQIARLGRGNSTMTLVGFATDGFPIYARYGFTNRTNATAGVTVMKSNYRLRTAAELSAAGYSGRPSASIAPFGAFEQDWVYDATSSLSHSGHLDACNGRYGVTPESPTVEVYHYYITDSYPFVPRCVFGTPSSWANDASVN